MEAIVIPPDLAATGWRWNERGHLVNDAYLVTIVTADPIADARICEATRERVRATRKPRQERLEGL